MKLGLYIFLFLTPIVHASSECSKTQLESFFESNEDILFLSPDNSSDEKVLVEKSLKWGHLSGRKFNYSFDESNHKFKIKNLAKYIWGIKHIEPGHLELSVANCLPKEKASDVEVVYKAWRKKNLSDLSNAIYEFDLNEIVLSAATKRYYNKNGELDIAAIEMLYKLKWDELINVILSHDIKINAAQAPEVIKYAIEKNSSDFLDIALRSKIDLSKVILSNGLMPISYAILLKAGEIYKKLFKNHSQLDELDSYGNNSLGYLLLVPRGEYPFHGSLDLYEMLGVKFGKSTRSLILKSVPRFAKPDSLEKIKRLDEIYFYSDDESKSIVTKYLPIIMANYSKYFAEPGVSLPGSDVDIKITQRLKEIKETKSKLKSDLGWIKYLELFYGLKPDLYNEALTHYSLIKTEDLLELIDPLTGKQFCFLDRIISKLNQRPELFEKLLPFLSMRCPSWPTQSSTAFHEAYRRSTYNFWQKEEYNKVLRPYINTISKEDVLARILTANISNRDISSNILRNVLYDLDLIAKSNLHINKIVNELFKLNQLGDVANSLRLGLSDRSLIEKLQSATSNHSVGNSDVSYAMFEPLSRLYLKKALWELLEIPKSKKSKVIIGNNRSYYACGKSKESSVFNRPNGKKIKSFDICKNLKITGYEASVTLGTPFGLIYKWDNDWLLFIETNRQYNEYGEVKVSKFDGVVGYIKWSDMLTPFSLSDGRYEIALAKGSIDKVEVNNSHFINSGNLSPCGGALVPEVTVYPNNTSLSLDYEHFLMPAGFASRKTVLKRNLSMKLDYYSCSSCHAE